MLLLRLDTQFGLGLALSVAAAETVAHSAPRTEDNSDSTARQAKIPLEWTDPTTGFRVVRFSRREGNNHSFLLSQQALRTCR